MRKILGLLVVSSSLFGQSIVWTHETSNGSYVHNAGYASFVYDPISKQVMFPADLTPGGSIFTSAFVAYCPPGSIFCISNGFTANNFYVSNATAHSVGGCNTADSTHWGVAHPYRQYWIETPRNILSFANGACSSTIPSYSGPRAQLVHWALNTDPTLDVNTISDSIDPPGGGSNFPNTPYQGVESASTYDSVDDVTFWYGGGLTLQHLVYCRGGSPTANQIHAGCTMTNTWLAITPLNGTATVSGTNVTILTGDTTAIMAGGDSVSFDGGSSYLIVNAVTGANTFTLTSSGPSGTRNWNLRPTQYWSAQLNYDATYQLAYEFGGTTVGESGQYNSTWAFDVYNTKWKHLALSTIVPEAEGGTLNSPAVGYDPTNHRLWYQHAIGSVAPMTYMYSMASDTWVIISSSGTPPPTNTNGYTAAYSPDCNCIVMATGGGTGSNWDVYVGQVSGVTNITSLSINEQLEPGDATGTTYGGFGGITRTNEPFCQGVPIADSLAITSPQTTLGLTTATAGQFRTLGVWPSGNSKYIEVCGILPSLSAGTTTTLNLQSGSSGNFGGGNLASGSNPITVNTGVATFTIKDGVGFNLIDTAVVGATTVLATSSAATRGLIILGPNPTASFPDNVTCTPTGTVTTNGTVVSWVSGDYFRLDGSWTGKTITINGVGYTIASTAFPSGVAQNSFIVNLTTSAGVQSSPVSYSVGTGSTCSTLYSSVNDTNASCGIEVNGPVYASIKCIGTYVDSSSHPYMHYTARMKFYQNESYARVEYTRRNADFNNSSDGGGNTFNTAAKGMQSNELRLDPNISGTISYTIGADASSCTGGICTGSLTSGSSDYVYGYTALPQASTFPAGVMIQNQDGNFTALNAYTFTSDNGYVVQKKVGGVVTNPAQNSVGTAFPQWFFADTANSSGVGIMVGMINGATNWPASVELISGGANAVVGMTPSENGNYLAGPGNGTAHQYAEWPAWSIKKDLVLEFHATNPANLKNDFLKLQYPLMVSESVAYINSTKVYPYTMPDLTTENNYYNNSWAAATNGDGSHPLVGTPCCTLDFSQNNISWALQAERENQWHNGGPSNQEEFRWDWLWRSFRLGSTTPQWGRYLAAKFYYDYEGGYVWQHSDGTAANGSDGTVNGFKWSAQSNGHLDSFGGTTLACSGSIGPGGSGCAKSTNSENSFLTWFTVPDLAHCWWWGIFDYYMLSGDEDVRDSVVANKDAYINTNTVLDGTSPGPAIVRAVGGTIISSSRFAEYLASIGDSDATAMLNTAKTNYTDWVLPDACISNYPVGCTMPNPTTQVGLDPPGINRARGAMGSTNGRGSGYCNDFVGEYRGIGNWYASIVIQGLLDLHRIAGSGWSEYTRSLDLAYGLAQFLNLEFNFDNGAAYMYLFGGVPPTAVGSSEFNGLAYSDTYDFTAACPGGTAVIAGQTSQFGSTVFTTINLPATNTVSQGSFFYYYVQAIVNGALTASQIRQFNIAIDEIRWASGGSQESYDLGNMQTVNLISAISSPPGGGLTLQDITINSVTNVGGNNWQISWNTPSGSTGPRLKVDGTRTVCSKLNCSSSTGLLNYDNVNSGTFGINPTNNVTWFGATDATGSLPTWVPGTSQVATVNMGVSSGVTVANLSLKAMMPSGNVPGTISNSVSSKIEIGGGVRR